MLEWIAEPIVTLGDTIAIDRLLVIVALASLGLAWLAHRRQRHPLVWYVAGVGGFALARGLVSGLIPEPLADPGPRPSAAYALWSNPSFRSDAALTILLALVVTGVLLAVQRLTRYANPDALDDRGDRYAASTRVQALASAVGSAIWLLFPIIIWVWVTLWLWTEANYSEIIVPALGYVALVVLFAAIQMKTEPGWQRNLLITVLGLLLVGAQMRYNATRPPASMFESNGSAPFFMPLIPAFFGLLIGQMLCATLPRRNYALAAWRVGVAAWTMTLVALLVKYMGYYDFQNSFAFDLASVIKAPLQVLLGVSDVWYAALPREVAPEQALAQMERWEVAVSAVAGLIVWGAVWASLLRRRRSAALIGLAERLQSASVHLTMRQRRTLLAVVLLVPALGLRTFTTFYPFIQSIFLSVQKYNPAFPPREYIALRNFERLSTDLVVRESLEFTLIFVFVSTAFQMLLGLAIAHLLNAEFRLRGLARTVSLIPWAVPMVVAALGFRWMFDDQFGMIPDLLRRFFGYDETWLINPVNARLAVVMVNIWKSTPFAALLLLAGLQGVSLDLYEAAKVDGANWFEQLRFITVPMLMPIIVTTSMFLLVWQLAVFDLPFAMTGGGPGFSTTVIAQKIYQEINSLNYSYASALSIAMVMVVSLIGGAGVIALRRVEVQG